jgi:iron complex outermembrane receptor protein
MNDKKNRFYADIAAFTYQLKNAIVRRTKENDQDYYVNAGGNHQRGVEAQLSYEIVPIVNGIVKSVLLQSAITISNFRFSNYQIGTADFSNNLLTGVPKSNFSNCIEAKFNHSGSLSFNYQHTSKIPLNDSNSAFSDAYDIVQGKINWQKKINKNTILNFTAGADNILNQDYSLGNDLNAFGGRFYNAAPKRNYFFGIGVQIK